MFFVDVERSKVASASPWDSRTSLSSRAFHSPSCTPSALGTAVGSAAAVLTTLRRAFVRRGRALVWAQARPEDDAVRTRVLS